MTEDIPEALARRLRTLQDLHAEGTPTIRPGWLTAEECAGNVPVAANDCHRLGATVLLTLAEGGLPLAGVVPLVRLRDLGLDDQTAQRWPYALAEEHPERLIHRAWGGETVILTTPVTSRHPHPRERAAVVSAALLAHQVDLDALPMAGVQTQHGGVATNTIVGDVAAGAHVIQTGDY